LVAAIVGCQPSASVQMGHDILPAPENVISAQHLAYRLGLTVDADSGAMVSLRNAANCVTLFADPGGQAYVNGKPVGPRGGFVRLRGVLFVPASLEGQMRYAMRPLPVTAKPPQAKGRRVVIDPGHGGKDPGAISPIGLMEKDVVLPVSLEVARLLRQAGHEVIMTRQIDVFLELDDRAEVANRRDADLFVSIHADSADNRDARGFTVYVRRGASSGSQTVANAVVRSLDSGSGLGSRGVREANYRVLVRTECPAILVELGFLSNRQDASLLRQDAVQKKLARCIAEGIDSFLKRPQ
jgi:N-acetylmuramoyl-L-alanine amidase